MPLGRPDRARRRGARHPCPSASAAPSTQTLLPIDDATIKSGSPSTNFGSATSLEVDNSPKMHFLMKFDTTGVTGAYSSAKLVLTNFNSSGNGGSFTKAGSDWQEEDVIWTSAPAAGSSVGSLGTVSGSSSSPKQYTVDVFSYIKTPGIYSFRVTSTSSNGADYYSKEKGSGLEPKLVIETPGPTTPSLSINDVSVTEDSTDAVFTLSLSPPNDSQTVTVDYSTADGSATAGSDYTAISGFLSFAPGVTSKTISVPVKEDSLDESNETFFVNLSGAVNAAITDGQGQGTIVDDDGVTTPVVTLVQTIKTSSLDPPSPDPAGITYLSGSDRLLVSDSEVEEMSIYEGANLYELSRTTGSLEATGKTTSYTTEPTGLALNPGDSTLYISDDNKREVFKRRPGPDGRFGTSDDVAVGQFDTSGFAGDPEDLTYDTDSGDLFVVDGVGKEVYRVTTSGNVVGSFDVGKYGAGDPEGIVYDSSRKTLFVLDHRSESLYEVDKAGALKNKIDISSINSVKAAGVTLAPASSGSGRINFWIVDRGVDNNDNSSENDGKLYEVAIDLPAAATASAASVSQQPGGASAMSLEATPSGDDSPAPPAPEGPNERREPAAAAMGSDAGKRGPRGRSAPDGPPRAHGRRDSGKKISASREGWRSDDGRSPSGGARPRD